MKAIIKEGKIIATALDNYPIQGWEQDVLEAPDGLTVENMHEWVYVDGALTRPVAELTRAERNRRLAKCDWVVIMHSEKGTSIPSEWSSYRQALRDITSHPKFPYLSEEDWPTRDIPPHLE